MFHRRSLKIVTAALLALAVVAPAQDRRRPNEKPGERPADPRREGDRGNWIGGKVVEVSSDGKTLTVETAPPGRGRDGRVEEAKRTDVRIGDKTTVLYSGVGPGGAVPTKGYSARVQLPDGNKGPALAVMLGGSASFSRRAPDLMGDVAAVSKGGTTLTLTLAGQERRRRDEEPKKVDVHTTDKTTLIFDNVTPGQAEIAEGMRALVWLEDGSKDQARRMMLVGKATVERRGDRAPDVTGKVAAVSKDGKTITLESPPQARGEEPRKADFMLTDKTAVVFHQVGPGGAKVAEGMLGRLWMEGSSKDHAARASFVGQVREREAMTVGRVVAISKDGKTLTLEQPSRVRGEEGKRLEVTIGEKTRVAYFGVGPGGAKPTEGYTAYVYQEGGTKYPAGIELHAGRAGGRPGERR
jgi:hypothetical protein